MHSPFPDVYIRGPSAYSEDFKQCYDTGDQFSEVWRDTRGGVGTWRLFVRKADADPDMPVHALIARIVVFGSSSSSSS